MPDDDAPWLWLDWDGEMAKTNHRRIKLPDSHWAVRAEKLFQKSVREEIAKHFAAGFPIYFMEGSMMYARFPDGTTRPERKVACRDRENSFKS